MPESLPPPLKPSPWGRWIDAKRQDGRGVSRNCRFPLRPLFVKMRLSHSAECDKREIINNFSAIDVQSAAEGILNRLAVRFVWTSPENCDKINDITIPVGE